MCKLQSASVYSLHILERGECANTLYIMLRKVEVCCIINHSDACTFSCSTIMVFKAYVKRPLGVKAPSLRFGKTAALGA
jgi:hypothetical protein